MAAFDTTRIVDQVTVKGALPDGYFQDQTILNIAYDVLLAEITPLIMARREEYYVKTKNYAITQSQAEYAIPDRAIGMGLREVRWVSNNYIRHLDRIDPRYADRLDEGQPYRFYLENNNVVLWPTPSNTQDTLRLTYFFRPSKLVPVSECAQISAINTTTKTLTLSSLPNTWSISDTFDIVKGRGGYEVIDFSLAASSVSSVSNTIVFVADLPSTVTVGDWVSLAGETCFPYMPQEAQIALIHGTVVGCLESLGDPAVAVSQQKFAEQKAYLERLLSVRIEGQAKSFKTRVL